MTKYRSRRELRRAHGGGVPGHTNHIEPALLAKGGAVCHEAHGGEVKGKHGHHHLAKRSRGGKWIGEARERMEKKGTVGSLHKAMGIPEGSKIPTAKLHKEMAKAKRTGNTKLERKVLFAENVRK